MPVVKLPSDVLERSDVTCTRAPLGVRFSQTSNGIIVVTGFESSNNEIERSGLVRVGDALLCVNEVPIELEEYDNVLETLEDGFPLMLTFGRTGDELAKQVREDAIRNALKIREKEDRNRLKELEAARAAKEQQKQSTRSQKQETRVQIASATARDSTSSATINTPYNEPTVYTAKDFSHNKFTTFQKQVALILIVMALFRFLYTFTLTPEIENIVPEEGEFIITEHESLGEGKPGFALTKDAVEHTEVETSNLVEVKQVEDPVGTKNNISSG